MSFSNCGLIRTIMASGCVSLFLFACLYLRFHTVPELHVQFMAYVIYAWVTAITLKVTENWRDNGCLFCDFLFCFWFLCSCEFMLLLLGFVSAND